MARNSKTASKKETVNPYFITSKPIDKAAPTYTTLRGLIRFLSAAQAHPDNFNVLLSKTAREKFIADYNASVSGSDYADLAITNFDIDKKLSQVFKLIYRSQNTRQKLVVMSLTDISSLSELNQAKFCKEMELRNIQLENDEMALSKVLNEIYSSLGLEYNAHILSMLLQLCGIKAVGKKEVLEWVKDENGVEKIDPETGNRIVAKYQRHIYLSIGNEAQFKKAFFLHLLNLASAVELSQTKQYVKYTERQLDKLGIKEYEDAIARELEKLEAKQAAAETAVA